MHRTMLLASLAILLWALGACGGKVVVDPSGAGGADSSGSTGGASRELCGTETCAPDERCCTTCNAPLQQTCAPKTQACPGPSPTCV